MAMIASGCDHRCVICRLARQEQESFECHWRGRLGQEAGRNYGVLCSVVLHLYGLRLCMFQVQTVGGWTCCLSCVVGGEDVE